jgi:NodT family efflux transporter outer membrane factor (OMF) lipoprotein
MKSTFVLCGLVAGLLCGCAGIRLGEYKRPESPAKTAWSHSSASTAAAAETISQQWWTQFGDPCLDALIARAIVSSIDLKLLVARIDAAAAQLGEAKTAGLPTLDLGAGTSYEKSTGQRFAKTFNVGTQVNWDLDVWGRATQGVQAQTAEFHASEAEWRAGYLTLVANVSTTYFKILQFDEQIDQQQRALGANERILGIHESMRKHGLGTQTQVLRQQAEINRLTRDLIELHRSRDVAQNALATLLGVPAGELKVATGHLQGHVQQPSVPVGLPLDLLARRPDVLAAEFRVLASHDLLGQAKLAQLPSISLTGRGGSASFALNELLRSFTFGLMPSINIPAFNPGIKARIKTSEAQAMVVAQDYRRVVIAAYEEVENTLTNLDAHRRQSNELHMEVNHLRLVSQQTRTQLDAGMVSQLEVLDTERSLLAAEIELLNIHQQVLTDTVTLYKALGGGWAPMEVAHASN